MSGEGWGVVFEPLRCGQCVEKGIQQWVTENDRVNVTL